MFAMAAMIAVAQFPVQTVFAHVDDSNLIANHDLEAAGADGQPVGWTPNAWGNLTSTLQYQDTGDAAHGKVGYTKVDNYVDGDAKWYFVPVNVTAGTAYTFSDAYRATAQTEVVAQYTDASGGVSYGWLGGLPASSSWATASYNVVVPSGVTKMSVFHVLPANGEMWTDDYSLAPVPVLPPTGNNLIANPSAEIANAGQPVGWSFNKWGDIDATSTYDTVGQDGSRSLKVAVSRYVDGDAKWYFEPVDVSASGTYTFTNTYKSTAVTETIVQIENTAGTYNYMYLGANSASPAAWTNTSYTFTVPSNAKKLSVFHVLAGVGELSVDNYALVKEELAPPTAGQIINASVETANPANPSVPHGWMPSSWGTNTAQFSYVNDPTRANTGSRALQLDVTKYTDGDAKWYFEPVALTAGADYQFSDWYKSNVDSRIVMEVVKIDGTTEYMELQIAPATNGQWRQYKASFTVPANAATISAYHMLSTVGQLVTDDFAFTPYTAVGFTRGLVSLTFDDGWEDNINTAIPIMGEYGYKSNQFYATTFMENSELGRAYAETTARAIRGQGHEMGSHTVTHPDLTTLTSTSLEYELAYSRAYLESVYGHSVSYFATPYGAYNTPVQQRIMANYSLHRTVDTGYNSRDNFNITQLKVQNVLSNTTAAEVKVWVEKAKTDNTWLILVYHRVANNPGPYDTTPTLFRQQMDAIQTSGVPVVTISQALAELQPQL